MRIAFVIIGLLLCAAVFVRVCCPSVFESKVKYASGVVSSIYLDSGKQATLKIQGLKTAFTVPSGFFRKLGIDGLKQRLVGKEVRVLYADRWTPLDPTCSKEAEQIYIGRDILLPGREQ
jgi:hypothetical protein